MQGAGEGEREAPEATGAAVPGLLPDQLVGAEAAVDAVPPWMVEVLSVAASAREEAGALASERGEFSTAVEVGGGGKEQEEGADGHARCARMM